ncbi:extracellular serine-rich protein [Aspergillus sclerotiicarbonarius CBS 121057]|uniref:Extracellular serine-rich protein n=1 Tax=Aspergillus sclerotiicarbonarius (strain CBS 121057 / IBT 28362) TaxID=1448318 RepID=A0A319F705_ASPSB|nr:extracellular serine-rich protein [Aspergillus sclerotiicarbonarius CBS 121057]
MSSLALSVSCFLGFITCNTPPGVWSQNPTISSASSSSTSSAEATGTPVPGTTLAVHSLTTTSSSSSFSSSSTAPSTLVTSVGSTSTFVQPSSSVSTNALDTMSLTSSLAVSVAPSATPVMAGSIAANILVIARDSASASVATSGLNAYGIPFTTLVVPQTGASLPALNGSDGGNFGGIVVASEVSYNYGNDSYQSALTTDQWNQLWAYQLAYGVRMVQYDVYPGPNYGASAAGDGCCATGVEQLMSFTDISDFSTSGLRTGAGVSTSGLWHYPATIANTTTTKQIAQFAANGTGSATTAAVINNFSGREQMAFFISFDTVWSATSTYLQHAWITWLTRGLYAGYRRVNLNTQIDDMFLETDIYKPTNTTFRITPTDLEGIASWLPTINAKMNTGSSYFVEVGHNGNGNIESAASTDSGYTECNGGGIEYNSPADTPLEWKKPLGTGTNLWPASPTTYNWTVACTELDALRVWWTTPANRDKFGHISHTFTHEEQDNATYADVFKEISFNQAWLKQVELSSAKYFTSNGIIPPAITGLHNGDALRAWWENGITNCVGDNTRSALLNQQNDMWPYWTNNVTDGFDGMQVNPRFATRIYYNCDTPDCTVQEWIDTSGASGDFDTLLATEKAEVMRHLLGLHHDPYMFHQANLRNADTSPITINGVSGQYSIMQAWVETQVQEFVRLVDWPLVTIKHQDMSDSFLARYTRDACKYSLRHTISNHQITGVTVSATGNTCSVPIPVTFPVAPTSTQGFPTEQIGNDPLTVWVQLSGSPVSFTLSTPIAL